MLVHILIIVININTGYTLLYVVVNYKIILYSNIANFINQIHDDKKILFHLIFL